jgi:HlyD family secretion protein
MKTRTKWILGAGVGLVVVGGGIAMVANRGEDLPKVTTADVIRRDLVAQVTCNGKVEARKKVELSAPIAGQIVNLAVREGDQVKKGDFLLQIDKVTLQATADSSKAALEALLSDRDAARANLERSRIEHEKSLASYQSGTISEVEFERARADYEANLASLQAIESRIDQARAMFIGAKDTLDKTTITSPMTGTITKLNVEEGEVAMIGTMNNPGTVLMTISDLSIMEAVMEVDETDVPQVTAGQEAILLIDAYPDTPFRGVVTEVGSSPITEVTGATEGIDFEVKIRIEDPPEELKPGLSVTADIITDHRENILALPLQSLVLRDLENPGDLKEEPEEGAIASRRRASTVASRARDEEGVFLLEEGEVRFVAVETGIVGELEIEAISGVDEEDTVVTGPFRVLRTLESGDRVTVEDRSASRP